MNQTIKIIFSAVVASCLTTLVVALLVFGVIQRRPVWTAANAGTSTVSSQTVIENSSIVDTVKKTTPAVVSIMISKREPISQQYAPGTNPFDLFGGFLSPQNNQDTQLQEIGGGSGFFVAGDGLIVTNQHVVGDKNAQYAVYTNDGQKHSAKVVAQDASQDIALIKIDQQGNKPYPFLSFGNSQNLQLGQTVISIGNALGEFRNTVSVGVVSGLSRSIVAGDITGQSEELNEVIQTDAAINPGNSGGPLLDIAGNVIGMNVAVAVGSQNVGFALPADAVKTAVDSVKTLGYISRPFLGVRYVEITDAIQTSEHLPVNYGVLIIRGQGQNEPAVVPGSPAARAGIVEKDIILKFDGVTLDQNHKLGSLVLDKHVGDTVELIVLHNNQQKTVSATLQEANK